MLIKILLVISIIVQTLATAYALRLVRATKYNSVWILFIVGFSLLSVERFVQLLMAGGHYVPRWWFGYLGIVVSVCLSIGVMYAHKLFKYIDRLNRQRQLLNKRMPLSHFFRSIFYLPSVVAGVAVYIVWSQLYNPFTGIFNDLLSLIGIQGPGWLIDENWAMPSLIIMNVFTCGGQMLILLAGLQDISDAYYEAAALDGASPRQVYFKITLPLLTPVVFFNLIMGIINSLQIFAQPQIMTDGGPMYATYVYGLHIYKTAFVYMDFGYACTLAWGLFILILLLSLFIFRSSRLWVHYREEVD